MVKKVILPESFDFNGVTKEPLTTRAILRLARDYFKAQPNKSMEMRVKILRFCVLTYNEFITEGDEAEQFTMALFWRFFYHLKMELLDDIKFHLICHKMNQDPYILSDHKVWVGSQMDLKSYYTDTELRCLEPIFTEEICERDGLSKFTYGGVSLWREHQYLRISPKGRYYYPYKVVPNDVD
ncbi:MAG: hypothetical protein LUF87_04715 [Alistipes sp.]|nr:hypothetical protein [Alistipes sp.]